MAGLTRPYWTRRLSRLVRVKLNGLLDITGAAQHLSERMGERITVRSVCTLQYRRLLPYVKT